MTQADEATETDSDSQPGAYLLESRRYRKHWLRDDRATLLTDWVCQNCGTTMLAGDPVYKMTRGGATFLGRCQDCKAAG